MSKPESSHAIALFFWLVSIIALVAAAFFGSRFSASQQLVLYSAILLGLSLAVATSFYQTPEPGEVLIVFGWAGPPKVVRGGVFALPIASQVFRMRLTPMWIEFPRPVSDERVPMTRGNRLITKDGLPVTTVARVQITIGSDDGSIIKAFHAFGRGGDADIKEHFTKILGGTVAKVVAETTAADLRENHQDFEDRVQKTSQFEEFGYRSTSRVTIEAVTELSIAAAGLEGGDKIRAQEVLKKLESESKEVLSKLESESDSKQTERDKKKTNEDAELAAEKAKVQHDATKKQADNDAEVAALKTKREKDDKIRHIEMDGEVKRAELQRDKDLSDSTVEKLIRDAMAEKEQHNLRMAKEEATKREDILRAQAESELEAIRLKLAEDKHRADIRMRGEELNQNIESQAGDLDYQLKKEVLKVSAETNRELAEAIAAALTKADVTLVGDSASAVQLTNELAKALSLGTRGKELLALLDDPRLHNAIRGIARAIRSDPAGPERVAQEDNPWRGTGTDVGADSTFEP